jgi:cytochrome c5
MLLLLTACGRDADFGRMWGESLQLPAGVSAADLPDPDSEGARLEARYCSQCHGIPSPATHSADEWPATVRRMALRMERSNRMGGRGMMGGGGMMGGRRSMPMGMSGAEAASRAELTEILDYLQGHALRTVAVPPEDGSDPAVTLFASSCARCHALPDPKQHTAEEWPAVVARMRQNMEKLGVAPISDAQADRIVEYLERQAGS